MKQYQTEDIRNIVVVGHGSEGKTTLVESMLFASGAIDRAVKDTFWQLDPGLIGKTYRALSEFVDWACDMEPSMETDFELFPPLVPGDEPNALVRPMNNIRSAAEEVLLLDIINK